VINLNEFIGAKVVRVDNELGEIEFDNGLTMHIDVFETYVFENEKGGV
jgi:hypothetical protein